MTCVGFAKPAARTDNAAQSGALNDVLSEGVEQSHDLVCSPAAGV